VTSYINTFLTSSLHDFNKGMQDPILLTVRIRLHSSQNNSKRQNKQAKHKSIIDKSDPLKGALSRPRAPTCEPHVFVPSSPDHHMTAGIVSDKARPVPLCREQHQTRKRRAINHTRALVHRSTCHHSRLALLCHDECALRSDFAFFVITNSLPTEDKGK
jgi:hypothetical protein